MCIRDRGDILYFVGEDPRSSAPHESRLNPMIPSGYDYDFIDTEAILTRLEVKDGRIVTPEGLSYRVLVFGDRKKVTLKLFRKIRDMVEQGMCLIVSSKPDGSPSLSDYQDDEDLREIINELWGDLDGELVKERSFGKGKIFWGMSLKDVFDRLNIRPDFEFSSKSSDALINYIHRRIGNEVDIYFIANRKRCAESLVCTFRVNGKQPEIWNPETGEVTAFPIYEVLEDGRVRLPIYLGPSGSIFVVFQSQTSNERFTSLERNGEVILSTKPFPKASSGLYPNVVNNFTISVWVKPEVNASLPFSAMFPSISGACWIFYPPEGEIIYGRNHAICGLVAGRNGIAVYERSKGNPIPVLTVQMPLEGWTHIALIYEDGIPSLFVNGRFVSRGAKSSGLVHPGVGEPYLNDTVTTQPTYTIGDMGKPEVFNKVLNFIDVKKIFDAGPPKIDEYLPVDIIGREKVELLFWKGGNYILRGPNSCIEFQIPNIEQSLEIASPWKVSFPPGLGAPSEIILTKLISLHKHQDIGVKYFSGTATYTSKFTLQPDFISEDKRIYLDLGRVENIAEVKVNGKDLGIVWKPPYLLDITDAVKIGENDLEVQVTNVWINRLIGDEQFPAEYDYGGDMGFMGGAIRELPDWYREGLPKPTGRRITFTTWHLYDKDSPLVESGLIGPVILKVSIKKSISG
ncbi:MAG: glycosyl hydrolase, partial [bacterium]|nr:glycosyl hydrolase [bacterium]